MNILGKAVEILVPIFTQSEVEEWRKSSDLDSNLENLCEAVLPKARELIERSECWRLPKYKPIDERLSQIKDAVYEAESVLDELEYDILKHGVEKSLPGINYLRRWMKGYPGKVKKSIDRLDSRCDQIKETCNSLGIPENPNEFSNTARPITTTFLDSSDIVYGRTKELNDVICLLGVPETESGGRKRKRENMSGLDIGQSSSSKENNGNASILSIVGIVGIGGVGKTTLAQMVCNDKSVESYFDLIMWVCVSEKFDAERLTREIIESATKKECSITNLDVLRKTLHKTLKSKRFLLVLDDVWSKDWQRLLKPMEEVSEGSVVMVTTRSDDCVKVASMHIDSNKIINLEGLEQKDYWEFFKSCAFGAAANSNNHPELEEIGKVICSRLKGSPLAAKTIGGLLRISSDVRHWKNIKNSKMWQLKQEEHDVHPVIQWSYQYLPSELKKCFSFCSLYPKDFKFTKTGLTKFWIVQGFIQSPERRGLNRRGLVRRGLEDLQQLEDIAGGYFDEFERRGFLLKFSPESHSLDYVIHDLMHDVCQSITKDECFCLETEDFVDKVSCDIRHVSVFVRGLKWGKQMKLCKYDKLFSLRIAGPCNYCSKAIENWCNKLTRLRSLSLAKSSINELPESIGNLSHLQCLDISFTKIETLPSAFCSLYNLQYLDMEGCSNIKCFPKRFNKLVNLQIFYLPVEKFSLVGHIENVAAAIQIDNSRFIVKLDNKIENLKHMSKLRGSLTIEELGNVPSKEAAEEAQLNNKPLINRLILSWSQTGGHIGDQSIINEHHEEEVLQYLSPHPDLSMLEINYYRGRKLPSWMKEEFLPKLTDFHIRGCHNVFTLPHLPGSITKLLIADCPRMTNLQEFLGQNTRFPALKKIFLRRCIELVSLPVESFVTLELLEISSCQKLTTMVLPPSIKILYLYSCRGLENSIPSILQNLTCLEQLRIGSCPGLVSIPAEVTSNLKSLSSLEIWGCAELQSLGGLQFLASINKLRITICPKLEETGGRSIFDRSDLNELLSISHGR